MTKINPGWKMFITGHIKFEIDQEVVCSCNAFFLSPFGSPILFSSEEFSSLVYSVDALLPVCI